MCQSGGQLPEANGRSRWLLQLCGDCFPCSDCIVLWSWSAFLHLWLVSRERWGMLGAQRYEWLNTKLTDFLWYANTSLCYFIERSYNCHYDNVTLIFDIKKTEYLAHYSHSAVLIPLWLLQRLRTQQCVHLQLWFSVWFILTSTLIWKFQNLVLSFSPKG